MSTTKKNSLILELIHSETTQSKKDYNRQYYQSHKDYWKEYYKTGHGIGRTKSDYQLTPKHYTNDPNAIIKEWDGTEEEKIGMKERKLKNVQSLINGMNEELKNTNRYDPRYDKLISELRKAQKTEKALKYDIGQMYANLEAKEKEAKTR